MAEKQIEFPPEQTHAKWFETGMMAVSIVCIILVIVILLVKPDGNFIGPW